MLRKKLGFSYNPNAKGEAMSNVRLYDGPLQTILHYLDGDIKPIQQKITLTLSKKQYTQFKLFGRGLQNILGAEAAFAASLILRGEKKDVENLLALIKTKPILLHIETEAIDLLGRRVKGKLLQIAAMAGDVDLKPCVKNEEDRGLIERLVATGHLSKDEVIDQLQCVMSKKALLINQQRNQRVYESIKRFGEQLIKPIDHMDTAAIQAYYKQLIDQLEKNLQTDTNEVITAGYVFDPIILYDVLKWAHHNIQIRGSTIMNEAFLINAFGKLQSKLSSRDAQVIREGIGFVVENHISPPPPRILRNDNIMAIRLNSSARLGVDFFLGYYGQDWGLMQTMPAIEAYVRQKQTALQKSCEIQPRTLKPNNRS